MEIQVATNCNPGKTILNTNTFLGYSNKDLARVAEYYHSCSYVLPTASSYLLEPLRSEGEREGTIAKVVVGGLDDGIRLRMASPAPGDSSAWALGNYRLIEIKPSVGVK